MVFTLTTDMILVRYFSLSEENIFYLSELTKQNLVWSSNNLGEHIWWMANFEPSPKKFSNCICRFIYRFNNFFFSNTCPKQKGPSEIQIIPQWRGMCHVTGTVFSQKKYEIFPNLIFLSFILLVHIHFAFIFGLHLFTY